MISEYKEYMEKRVEICAEAGRSSYQVKGILVGESRNLLHLKDAIRISSAWNTEGGSRISVNKSNLVTILATYDQHQPVA
jgi:hypothetical protein